MVPLKLSHGSLILHFSPTPSPASCFVNAPPHHHCHFIQTPLPPLCITLNCGFQPHTQNWAPAAWFQIFCPNPPPTSQFTNAPLSPPPSPPHRNHPTTILPPPHIILNCHFQWLRFKTGNPKVCHEYTKGWIFPHHTWTCTHCTCAWYTLIPTCKSCGVLRYHTIIIIKVCLFSPYKALGPDKIPNIVLMKCIDVLIDHLFFIFRAIFELNVYHPMAWVNHSSFAQNRQDSIQCSQVLLPNRSHWHYTQSLFDPLHQTHIPDRETQPVTPHSIQWVPRSQHDRHHASDSTQDQKHLEERQSCSGTLFRRPRSLSQHHQRTAYSQYVFTKSTQMLHWYRCPLAYRLNHTPQIQQLCLWPHPSQQWYYPRRSIFDELLQLLQHPPYWDSLFGWWTLPRLRWWLHDACGWRLV